MLYSMIRMEVTHNLYSVCVLWDNEDLPERQTFFTLCLLCFYYYPEASCLLWWVLYTKFPTILQAQESLVKDYRFSEKLWLSLKGRVEKERWKMVVVWGGGGVLGEHTKKKHLASSVLVSLATDETWWALMAGNWRTLGCLATVFGLRAADGSGWCLWWVHGCFSSMVPDRLQYPTSPHQTRTHACGTALLVWICLSLGSLYLL